MKQNEDQIKYIARCLPVYDAVVNEWSNKTIKLDALLNMHSPDAYCYGLELSKQDKFVYSLAGCKLGKTLLSVDFIEWAIQNIISEDTQVRLKEHKLDSDGQSLLKKQLELVKTDEGLLSKSKTLQSNAQPKYCDKAASPKMKEADENIQKNAQHAENQKKFKWKERHAVSSFWY